MVWKNLALRWHTFFIEGAMTQKVGNNKFRLIARHV
jgi:hypothetical protein